MRTCTIDECSKPIKSVGRGLCAMHDARWHRHGDPAVVKRGALRADWVGDAVGYRAMHKRVEMARGKAASQPCSDCSGPAEQWAYDNTDPQFVESERNGSLVRYSLDVERYKPMCRSCHKRFDNADRPASGRVLRRVALRGAANGNARLTTEQAQDMRRRYGGGQPVNVSAIAREFDVSRSTVDRVLAGISHRDCELAQ